MNPVQDAKPRSLSRRTICRSEDAASVQLPQLQCAAEASQLSCSGFFLHLLQQTPVMRGSLEAVHVSQRLPLRCTAN